MKRYSCPNCQNAMHFANSACVRCSTETGYWHGTDTLVALQGASSSNRPLAPCANRQTISCNWLCDGSEINSGYCLSCSHSIMIPDLSLPGNLERWMKLERAKRLLFRSLVQLGLPFSTIGPNGMQEVLLFEFKADAESGEKVLTGHTGGVITVNISEADDDIREANRMQMGERYRTLIGHFRHEVGHFYWDALVRDKGRLDEFRSLFGDERADYSEALQRHYAQGQSTDWSLAHVSSYATSHPWEDFAETFAHYFHMVDGIETALSYSILPPLEDRSAPTISNSAYGETRMDALVAAWVPLTVAMNAMNRSIGNIDYYPFVLSNAVLAKLSFIHEIVHAGAVNASPRG